MASVGDHGEELHAPLAVWALECVDGEGAPEQVGPRAVGRAWALDRCIVAGIGLLAGVGRQGPDACAQLAGGGEDACVLDGMVARRRYAGRESADEGERVHVDGDGAVGVG